MFVYISMSDLSLKYILVFSLLSFSDALSKLTKKPTSQQPALKYKQLHIYIYIYIHIYIFICYFSSDLLSGAFIAWKPIEMLKQ